MQPRGHLPFILKLAYYPGQRADVMEDQAVGDQMIVLDDLPLLIPAVLRNDPSPPKNTHFKKWFNCSLLFVAAWIVARSSLSARYRRRKPVLITTRVPERPGTACSSGCMFQGDAGFLRRQPSCAYCGRSAKDGAYDRRNRREPPRDVPRAFK